MKKKGLLLGCIILLMFSLTGCIDKEERAKGNEDLRKGRELVMEYVKDTYGNDAKVSDIDAFYIRRTYDSVIPSYAKMASGFLKATVSINDTNFDMLYHVNTGEVLTKANVPAIKEGFLTQVNKTLGTVNFKQCSMRIYTVDIKDPEIEQYISPDITTYQELLEAGGYVLELTFRSTAQDLPAEEQWRKVNDLFTGENIETQVYLLFVNYKDEAGLKEEENTNYYSYTKHLDSYAEKEGAMKNIDNMVYINLYGDIQVIHGK